MARYPIQVTDDAQRDSPAKLKTTAGKSKPVAPAPIPVPQTSQAQPQAQLGGTTPPTERELIRQKRLQRFSSGSAQHDVVERTTSGDSIQSPLLSPNVAGASSTANIPRLDSTPTAAAFEVGDMIQVDRPNSAPWYGVIQWVGTLPGHACPSAGVEMV